MRIENLNSVCFDCISPYRIQVRNCKVLLEKKSENMQNDRIYPGYWSCWPGGSYPLILLESF
jgi:hypothetical protein